SRPGDPELMAILPTIGEDFVDICFDMLHGTLTEVKFLKKSAVVTYAVPLTYGGYRDQYSGSNEVNLNPAKELAKSLHGRLRIYPGSMEQRDGFTYALKSRAVASVGIGDDIREAREISLKGVKAIDGPLWNRWDIAGEKHIASCIEHMRILRCR
ncbi:MAG: hypothetical protein QXU67_02705, partial [Candidatus Bathyarchaeia archaeon]